MELPASRAYYEGRDTRHIREYVEEFLAFGRDEFAKKYPHAMLLVACGGEAEENAEFRTAVMTREAMAALRAEGEGPRSAVAPLAGVPAGHVVPVVKKPGSAFEDQIGVGRTRNSDVCVPVPKVSKYHAYFTKLPDGSYTVTDAGSRNGTFVDSERLTMRTPTPLQDGADLAFGPCRFIFYGPASFCAA